MKLLIRNTERRKETDGEGAAEFLSVYTGEAEYGLPVGAVEYILTGQEVNCETVKVDYEAMLGFLSWEGDTIPALDLERHLDQGRSSRPRTPTRWRSEGAVVIVEIDGRRYALAADGVGSILALENSAVRPFPREISAVVPALFSGTTMIEGRVFTLLDVHSVFSARVRAYLDSLRDEFIEKKVAKS